MSNVMMVCTCPENGGGKITKPSYDMISYRTKEGKVRPKTTWTDEFVKIWEK